MTLRAECDRCGKLGTGFIEDFSADWIRVHHRTNFSPWHNKPFPSVAGDYCSVECLLNAVAEAANEESEMKNNGPK